MEGSVQSFFQAQPTEPLVSFNIHI